MREAAPSIARRARKRDRNNKTAGRSARSAAAHGAGIPAALRRGAGQPPVPPARPFPCVYYRGAFGAGTALVNLPPGAARLAPGHALFLERPRNLRARPRCAAQPPLPPPPPQKKSILLLTLSKVQKECVWQLVISSLFIIVPSHLS